MWAPPFYKLSPQQVKWCISQPCRPGFAVGAKGAAASCHLPWRRPRAASSLPSGETRFEACLGSLLDSLSVDFAEAASVGLPAAPACVWLSLRHLGRERWVSPFRVQGFHSVWHSVTLWSCFPSLIFTLMLLERQMNFFRGQVMRRCLFVHRLL